MTGLIVSACNRTYYGEIGETYDLELHRPKEDKMPYICFLTFTAKDGDAGDLVQVSAYKVNFRYTFIICTYKVEKCVLVSAVCCTKLQLNITLQLSNCT